MKNKNQIYVSVMQFINKTNEVWKLRAMLIEALDNSKDQSIVTDVYENWMQDSEEPKRITFARQCDCCKEGMNTGYVVGDGCAYYCSDDCLQWEYAQEQLEKAYENNEYYYTEWEEDDHQYVVNDDGELEEIE